MKKTKSKTKIKQRVEENKAVALPYTFSRKSETLRCKIRQRGRPKKDIDVGVIFHMIHNKATIKAVARHLGINRDTIYANFQAVIDRARVSHRETWHKIRDEWFAGWLESKKNKEAERKRKLKCRNCLYRQRKKMQIIFRQI